MLTQAIDGNVPALITLADYYIKGTNGINKNYKEAEEYLKEVYSKGTRQQMAEAKIRISRIYRIGGDGVAKNYSQAKKCYEEALGLLGGSQESNALKVKIKCVLNVIKQNSGAPSSSGSQDSSNQEGLATVAENLGEFGLSGQQARKRNRKESESTASNSNEESNGSRNKKRTKRE